MFLLVTALSDRQLVPCCHCDYPSKWIFTIEQFVKFVGMR